MMFYLDGDNLLFDSPHEDRRILALEYTILVVEKQHKLLNQLLTSAFFAT